MELRRGMLFSGVKSVDYIPNCEFLYFSVPSSSDTMNYVVNTSNSTRLSCFGAGVQAGVYNSSARYVDNGIDKPVIKIPNNSKSVTISFEDASKTYNANSAITICWMSDEPCGSTIYPDAALFISSDSYKARDEATKTITIPQNVNAMLVQIRVVSAISSDNVTPNDAIEALGLSIVFNK